MHSLLGTSFHLWRVLAVFRVLVLALLSDTQSFLWRPVPVGNCSAGRWMASFWLSSHSFQSLRRRVADSPGSSLSTILMLFLDLSLLSGYVWPYIGCLESVSCLYFSTLALMFLLICGGAMPAVLYRSVKGVGRRRPVTMRQALLSSGSTFFAWVDLAQTADAYSAVE